MRSLTEIQKPAVITWADNLKQVLDFGDRIDPREQSTLEIVGYHSSINMKYPLVLVPARELGFKFLIAEAWWILSGRNDVRSIAPYAKGISKFSDDGVHFNGAYGPPIRDQLNYVIDTLAKDPASRQAVITIWRPNPRQSKDIPCTISAQFLLRKIEFDKYAIHCIDTMRSSDLWLGWPYDVFNFTMLSYYIAIELSRQHKMRITLGNLTLQAGSQHIYSQHIQSAKNACLEISSGRYETPNIHSLLYGDHGHPDSGDSLIALLESEKDGGHFVKTCGELVKKCGR